MIVIDEKINAVSHDDVIKWKHFPRYWPFVRGIHRSLVNSSHKGQWRRAFMFTLICARINDWVNNREAGDLRCHRTHYDVIVMCWLNDIVVCWDIYRLSVDNYRVVIWDAKGINALRPRQNGRHFPDILKCILNAEVCLFFQWYFSIIFAVLTENSHEGNVE